MMLTAPITHVLSGDELDQAKLHALLEQASVFKHNRLHARTALSDYHLALVFDKPSLRTRMSFTVAMHECGGHIIDSVNTTRRIEEPEDQIRVLQAYCQAVVIRTIDDQKLQRMQQIATISIINGATNLYHPCQILADLFTLHQHFGSLDTLTLAYIGDGTNVLHSLLILAPKLGIRIHYCCPNGCGPKPDIVAKAGDAAVSFPSPLLAVKDSDAVYTNAWSRVSASNKYERAFDGFQINEAVMQQARDHAVLLHCMPMNRGQEVNDSVIEQPYSLIFAQSSHRLPVQKALLITLLNPTNTA